MCVCVCFQKTNRYDWHFFFKNKAFIYNESYSLFSILKMTHIVPHRWNIKIALWFGLNHWLLLRNLCSPNAVQFNNPSYKMHTKSLFLHVAQWIAWWDSTISRYLKLGHVTYFLWFQYVLSIYVGPWDFPLLVYALGAIWKSCIHS